LIEKAPAVLPQADVEMAEFLHAPMIERGIDVIVGDGLAKFADKGKSIDVRYSAFY
jgi:NADPH-dependent 2,4-dienoyl-CoA reductase/sulfur reductase-like enzyme